MFKRKSRAKKASKVAGRAIKAGRPYAEAAKPYVDKAKPYVEKAKPYVDRIGQVAQERGAPLVEHARDFAEDAAHDLAPRIEHARDVLKDEVAPRVNSAVSEVLVASAPYREEAARRTSAAVAAIKGDVAVTKPKRHWGRKLLIVSGIAGVIAIAYKYLTGESSTSGWQTPAPPPAPTPPPTPPTTPPPGSTGPATADQAYTSDAGTGATDAAEAGAQADAAGDETTAEAKSAEAQAAEEAEQNQADAGTGGDADKTT